jgi:hypothetical protein
MKRTLLVAVVLVAGVDMAVATSCPKDMRAIDWALRTAQLTQRQRADATRYRQEGEQLHLTNRHGEAVAAFTKAKVILNVK